MRGERRGGVGTGMGTGMERDNNLFLYDTCLVYEYGSEEEEGEEEEEEEEEEGEEEEEEEEERKKDLCSTIRLNPACPCLVITGLLDLETLALRQGLEWMLSRSQLSCEAPLYARVSYLCAVHPTSHGGESKGELND